MKSNRPLKSRLTLALVSIVALAGCGGSGSSWDDFQPRSATVADLSEESFEYSWLPQGNPLDPDLGLMSLRFGELDENGEGSFTLQEEDGGSVTGTVDLDSPNLRLTVESISGEVGVAVGQSIEVKAEADVDDGRLRLRDDGRGVEATSDNE